MTRDVPLNDLLNDLHSEHEQTVLAAIRALGERRALAAVDELLPRRTWRNAIGQAAREAMTAIGAEAIPLLLGYLVRPAEPDVLPLIRAFGCMGEPALPALVGAMHSGLRQQIVPLRQRDVGVVALWAMAEMGIVAVPSIVAILPEVGQTMHKPLWDIFSNFGEAAVAPLRQVVLQAPHPEQFVSPNPRVATLFCAIGAPSQTALVTLLHDAHPIRRQIGAQGLVCMGRVDLIPVLAAALYDADEDVCYQVARALNAIHDEAVEPIMAAAAKDHPVLFVRDTLRNWLTERQRQRIRSTRDQHYP